MMRIDNEKLTVSVSAGLDPSTRPISKIRLHKCGMHCLSDVLTTSHSHNDEQHTNQ